MLHKNAGNSLRLRHITLSAMLLIGALPVTGESALADVSDCFDQSFSNYRTRGEANSELRGCFPVGSHPSEIIQFFTGHSYGFREKTMYDFLDQKDVKVLLFFREISRSTGHKDKWAIIVLVDREEGTVIHTETEANLDPNRYRERGIPFDYLNFTRTDLEVALRTYVVGKQRAEAVSIMAQLGAEKRLDGRNKSVFDFITNEVPAKSRLLLVETLLVVVVNYDVDSVVKSVDVN